MHRIAMMFKFCCLFFTLVATILPTVSVAVDYSYKEVKDFKTLADFKTVSEFERHYGAYVKDCLDNTYGGTGGIPCFVGYELWDRELNFYYKELMALLGEKEKTLLRDSQRAWVNEKEKTIKFNSALMDNKYPSMGTMYALIRAGEADSLMTPIVKGRALLLKEWLEDLKNKDNDFM